MSVLIRGIPLPSVLAREALGSSTRVSCTISTGQAGSQHYFTESCQHGAWVKLDSGTTRRPFRGSPVKL